MENELILTKVAIASNTEFINKLIDKLDIKKTDKVAVAFWVSPIVYREVCKRSNDVYYIEDVSSKGIFGNIEKAKFIDLNKGEYWPNMKFDKVIMNPPYERNLHLKVLEEVISHLNNEGTVINLSPTRWIKDQLAPYKKNSDYLRFENSISKHINDIESVDIIDANNYFEAGIMSDLGIYTIVASDGKYNYKASNKILLKVLSKMPESLDDRMEYNMRDGWRWQTNDIQPLNAQGGKKYSYGWYRRFCIFNHLRSTVYHNGMRDGKDWSQFNSGIKRPENSPIPESIKFNTKKEAINFEESLKTTFYKYLVLLEKNDQHTPRKYLPYMCDYTQPWTNERFYKYFNITKEEQKIIEETMAQYES